jgi:IS30 family transposase
VTLHQSPGAYLVIQNASIQHAWDDQENNQGSTLSYQVFDQKTYKAATASRESDARRAAARKFCKPTLWFSHHLPVWLERGMSPEQIAHRLKQEQPHRRVSHGWIYRFLAADQRAGGEL